MESFNKKESAPTMFDLVSTQARNIGLELTQDEYDQIMSKLNLTQEERDLLLDNNIYNQQSLSPEQKQTKYNAESRIRDITSRFVDEKFQSNK